MTACTKAKYDTRRQARTARRRLLSIGRGDTNLRPYFCKPCGFFHLGHLAADVRHGEMTRAETYGGGDAA